MFRRKKEKRKRKILVLIDWENLLQNMDLGSPLNFSLSSAFEKLLNWLEGIGEISKICLFGPIHTIQDHLGMFHSYGFFTIVCPKLTKKRETIDTTDAIFIRYGEKEIDQNPDITHLCIGSGDNDFIPLVAKAKRKKIRIAIVYSNLTSLSDDLIAIANKHPVTKKRMVYRFSPTQN